MNLDISSVPLQQKFNFPGFLSFSSHVLVHKEHNILVNLEQLFLLLGSPGYLYSKNQKKQPTPLLLLF